jgi:hypothetical protein
MYVSITELLKAMRKKKKRSAGPNKKGGEGPEVAALYTSKTTMRF